MEVITPEQQKKLNNFIDTYKKINNFDRENNFQLKVIHPGLVHYYFTVKEKHLSSPNTCHGGVLSALMDATLGLPVLSKTILEDQVCSTVEFKINYLAPAKLNMEILGIGQVTFYGKSLVVSEATLYEAATNKALAKGMGTFNRYPAPDSIVKIL